MATSFTYTGRIVNYTVGTGGVYRITAYGAQGGSGGGGTGGDGAEIAGDFTLTSGEVLRILVGGEGRSRSFGGSGGGGTFVIAAPTGGARYGTKLVIAGGGGGGSTLLMAKPAGAD